MKLKFKVLIIVVWEKISKTSPSASCWIAQSLVKGQIISECPYEKIVYPKIATKKFPRFLPWPLRRGQIKK